MLPKVHWIRMKPWHTKPVKSTGNGIEAQSKFLYRTDFTSPNNPIAVTFEPPSCKRDLLGYRTGLLLLLSSLREQTDTAYVHLSEISLWSMKCVRIRISKFSLFLINGYIWMINILFLFRKRVEVNQNTIPCSIAKASKELWKYHGVLPNFNVLLSVSCICFNTHQYIKFSSFCRPSITWIETASFFIMKMGRKGS